MGGALKELKMGRHKKIWALNQINEGKKADLGGGGGRGREKIVFFFYQFIYYFFFLAFVI